MPEVAYLVTVTTRSPRPGEVQGQSYHFISRAEYDRLLTADQLLAPAEVHGNWYGAPLRDVREYLRRGRDVLMKIDVQGALQVRRRIPQAVFIFLAPPSFEDLVARLRARHTESGAVLQRRLQDARFEMDQLPSYDYCVVNQDDAVEEAAGEVTCIIRAERARVHRQPIGLSEC
jgi:guanylate kinase